MQPFSSKATVPLYFTAAVLLLWGFSFHIVETLGAESFNFVLPIAYFSALIFVVLSVREVLGSVTINKNERLFWVATLILFSMLAGLVYVISGRNKVLNIQTE
jgi:hypothetical protein